VSDRSGASETKGLQNFRSQVVSHDRIDEKQSACSLQCCHPSLLPTRSPEILNSASHNTNVHDGRWQQALEQDWWLGSNKSATPNG
jgi:hypothetical protein